MAASEVAWRSLRWKHKNASSFKAEEITSQNIDSVILVFAKLDLRQNRHRNFVSFLYFISKLLYGHDDRT